MMPGSPDRYGRRVQAMLADLTAAELSPGDWERLTPLFEDADAKLAQYRAVPIHDVAALKQARESVECLAQAVANATGQALRPLEAGQRGLNLKPAQAAAADNSADKFDLPPQAPEPLRTVFQRMIYGSETPS